MAFRTILVHMNDRYRAAWLLSHVVQLARISDAHVIGLHVAGSADQARHELQHVDKDIAFLESLFRERTDDERFSAEWRAIRADRRSAAAALLRHARPADLIVIGQTDPEADPGWLSDAPARLAIESGRPVLIIPRAYQAAVLPKNVVIAWNHGREATRAAFDALPLIKGARSVDLVTIDEGHAADSDESDDVLTTTALAEALARHAVRPTITRLRAEGPVGAQLCTRAMAQEADLIVMGAYGRTQISEMVFGGVTRYMLANMPVPVLLAH